MLDQQWAYRVDQSNQRSGRSRWEDREPCTDSAGTTECRVEGRRERGGEREREKEGGRERESHLR